MTDVPNPNTYLNYGVWPEWLLISFLILISIFYWTISKRIGFLALYLTILSLTIGFIITLYFPYLYTENHLLPLTHPHIQAAMTLFSFFIPFARGKIDMILCLLLPFMISIIYLSILEIPVFSIVGGVLIGGFISYMYYRSLDWIEAMPEAYLFAFAIILPVFLSGLLYPNMNLLLLPGILLGTGIGVTIEQLKIKMSIQSSTLLAKITAIFIGSSGIIAIYLFIVMIAPSDLAVGILAGLWISLLVPALLLFTNLYDAQTKN